MKRQRTEIMTHILKLCIHPTRKTRIMYQTNLSHEQLKSYLQLLTVQNLLAHDSPEYTTTEKGLRFLQAFANLNDVLEDRISGTPERTISESYREVQIIRIGTKTISEKLEKDAQEHGKTESRQILDSIKKTKTNL